MLCFASLLLVGLLPLAVSAAPNPAASTTSATSIASSICSKDGIYQQLSALGLAPAASEFCTTYVRSTVSGTTTITKPATASATATVTTKTIVQKRAFSFDLAGLVPSSLLSSACSCLLVTATPSPVTVYPYTATTTKTVTTVTKTTKVIETCASAAFTSPIQNGDFSQNSAYWTITTNIQQTCGSPNIGICYNLVGPGLYMYGPQVTTFAQTLVACAGQKYLATITYKAEFCGEPFYFQVDGQTLIDGTNQACGEGVYPTLDGGPFHTQNATFVPTSNSPVFSIYVNSTRYAADDWQVQNIVIAPTQ